LKGGAAMRILAIALIMVLGIAIALFAGVNENGKVAIHVLDHSGKRSCTNQFPVIAGCEDIITTNAGTNVDFFPVFFDLAEYTGVEYGVTWSGPSCAFTSCADFAIGGIVNSGDGISQTWSDCHDEAVAIPGFGWIYSYGMICIVPHPKYGGPNVTDCSTPKIIDSLETVSLGCAGTNGFEGDDPCTLKVSTNPTTWGQIKGMFR